MRHGIVAPNPRAAAVAARLIVDEGHFARVVTVGKHTAVIAHAPTAVVVQACQLAAFDPEVVG
jgi:hypothetical protein